MTTTDPIGAVGAGGNPYVGPRPFKIGERLWGRRREIGELADLLYAERIVLLHSPSGAGKSSLIAAGLVPRLRERFEVLPIIRVNQAPPPAAERVVSRYAWSALESLEAERRSLPPEALLQTTLGDYLANLPRPDGAPRRTLLLFDQFEELLTIDPLAVGEKERFCAELTTVLEDDSNWALFAVREDFVGPLERYRDRLPSRLRNTYALRLLGRAEAAEAVERPLKDGPRSFAAGVIDALIDDLATVKVQQPDGSDRPEPGPWVEPVQLQVVCARLWDDLPATVESIGLDHLRQFGKVSEALAGYYASTVGKVAGGTGGDERAIRQWFDRRLITRTETRHQVRREPGASGGLANGLIEQLVGAHLIRAEERAGATWYELAHDRMIQPVLGSNRAWFEQHLHPMQRQAAAWAAHSRPDAMLLRDDALAAAEAWVGTAAVTLGDEEKDLLARSRALRDAVLREDERRRRELRRTRFAAGVMGLLFLLAIAAIGYAWKQQQKVRPFEYLGRLESLKAMVATPTDFGEADIIRLLTERAELFRKVDAVAKARDAVSEPALHSTFVRLAEDLKALAPRTPADTVEWPLSAAARVGRLADFSTDLEARWRQAIAAILTSPSYDGLRLEPQLGLVPLGQDPDSKLWEFAHVLTGDVPVWDCEKAKAAQPPERGCIVRSPEMGVVLVLIPAGHFQMGDDASDEDDEKPAHRVEFARPFFMSKYEMTQAQWLRLVGRNPSYLQAGAGAGLRPVEQVSWEDVMDFVPSVGLRLPSEAEWEYATRAGTATDFSCDPDKLQEHAWIGENSQDEASPIGSTFPVGLKHPNPFGLHDVHGNVWEWVQDTYQESYDVAGELAPRTAEPGAVNRVFRGGSFSYPAGNCRSADRSRDSPGLRDSDLGFRPARSLR